MLHQCYITRPICHQICLTGEFAPQSFFHRFCNQNITVQFFRSFSPETNGPHVAKAKANILLRCTVWQHNAVSRVHAVANYHCAAIRSSRNQVQQILQSNVPKTKCLSPSPPRLCLPEESKRKTMCDIKMGAEKKQRQQPCIPAGSDNPICSAVAELSSGCILWDLKGTRSKTEGAGRRPQEPPGLIWTSKPIADVTEDTVQIFAIYFQCFAHSSHGKTKLQSSSWILPLSIITS